MVTITPVAEQKIHELMKEEKDVVGLRIYVRGGGCHGYQYGMAFESKMAEDDTVIEKGDVKVIMDLIAELPRQNRGKAIDLRVATFALFGMMNWIYTWYQPKRDLPFPQLIEQMLRIYFFGLVAASSGDESWFTAAPSSNHKAAFSLWENIT